MESGFVYAPYLPLYRTPDIKIPDLRGFTGKTFEPRHYRRMTYFP